MVLCYKWYNAFYPNLAHNRFIKFPVSPVTSTYSVVGASAIGCTAVAQALIKTRALPQPSILGCATKHIMYVNTFTLEGVGGYWYARSGLGYNMTGRQVNVVKAEFTIRATIHLLLRLLWVPGEAVTTSVTVYDLPHGMLSGIPKMFARHCGQNYFVPLGIRRHYKRELEHERMFTQE